MALFPLSGVLHLFDLFNLSFSSQIHKRIMEESVADVRTTLETGGDPVVPVGGSIRPAVYFDAAN